MGKRYNNSVLGNKPFRRIPGSHWQEKSSKIRTQYIVHTPQLAAQRLRKPDARPLLASMSERMSTRQFTCIGTVLVHHLIDDLHLQYMNMSIGIVAICFRILYVMHILTYAKHTSPIQSYTAKYLIHRKTASSSLSQTCANGVPLRACSY